MRGERFEPRVQAPVVRNPLLIAIVFVFAILSGGLIYFQEHARVAESSAASSRLQRVERQLKRLSASIADGSNPPVVKPVPIPLVPAGPLPSTPERVSTATLAPTDAVDDLEATRARKKAELKLVEDTWQTERADRTWSVATEELLRATFKGEEFSAANLSVECRTTMCRVDVSSEDPLVGRGVVQKIAGKVPWDSAGVLQFDLRTGAGSVYLSREGATMPKLDVASTNSRPRP